eukprot:SAG31_NODE_4719_length_3010_cov_1.948128_5_plen_60_part_00
MQPPLRLRKPKLRMMRQMMEQLQKPPSSTSMHTQLSSSWPPRRCSASSWHSRPAVRCRP